MMIACALVPLSVARVCVCVCVFLCVCVRVRVYVCLHVCVCVRVCVYTCSSSDLFAPCICTTASIQTRPCPRTAHAQRCVFSNVHDTCTFQPQSLARLHLNAIDVVLVHACINFSKVLWTSLFFSFSLCVYITPHLRVGGREPRPQRWHPEVC